MVIAASFPVAGARPSSPRTARPARPRISLARPALRLTARGRLVLLAVSSVLLLLVVVFSGQFTADAGTGAGEQGRATGVVVVQAGETLWQIARDVAPNADPRETLTLIRSLNGLGDAPISPGQTIVVPVPGAAAF